MSAPGFLASVANLNEMAQALAFGVDIVDLKDPAQGALGAWSPEMLEAAVARWRAAGEPRPQLSATVGDHPLDPQRLADAARSVAATGVPLVKIGFDLPVEGAHAALAPCLAALAPVARSTRLIAVLFADRRPDLAVVPDFAAAGFAGVMLDTADKQAGGLLRHMGLAQLEGFVTQARAHRLMSGLAGSLTLADIAPLTALEPDYLGFRGALCAAGRVSALDPARLTAVANALSTHGSKAPA